MIKFYKENINAIIPRISRPGDAGFDLYALEDGEVYPLEQVMVRTGICCAIPEGYAGRVMIRSGLAFKFDLTVNAGLIDSNYRGEIKILLVNLSPVTRYIFKAGDRIAQMIVLPVMTEAEEVTFLDDTERGGAGFGSSGK